MRDPLPVSRLADPRARRGLRRRGAALAVLVLLVGCAASPRVLSIRLGDGLAVPPHALDDYGSATRALAAIIRSELDLPLPTEFRVFIFPTRVAYARGLVDTAGMPTDRAAEIAAHSAGLGQHRRLFLAEEAVRGVPRRMRLAVLAHELTHLAQYQISGGRRGRSEQWLREGMADWVAGRVLERLGETTFAAERGEALAAVARALPGLGEPPPALVELGRPRGWEARHRHLGEAVTYRLAFLLADDLIGRHGLSRVRDYFAAFAATDDRFGHFERAFGLSLVAFEREAWARLRVELGLRPPPAADPRGAPRPAGRPRQVARASQPPTAHWENTWSGAGPSGRRAGGREYRRAGGGSL